LGFGAVITKKPLKIIKKPKIMKKIKEQISLIVISILITIGTTSCDKPTHSREPEIKIQPHDLTVLLGDNDDTHCLSVRASDPDGDVLSFQWANPGETDIDPDILIPGATDSIFIPDKSKLGTTKYCVAVSDGNYSVPSVLVTVWVVNSLPD
jgi:hypothetical protein